MPSPRLARSLIASRTERISVSTVSAVCRGRLLDLQGAYRSWSYSLPAKVADSATAEALPAICEIERQLGVLAQKTSAAAACAPFRRACTASQGP
jgi:hypothetical protein